MSYATFALGTLFNLGSFAYLARVRSLTAPLIAYWQFTLLMQLPEGATWTQLRETSPDVSAASRAAMLLNVLQPVALYLVVRIAYRRTLPAAGVATLMYALLIVADAPHIWREAASIAPDPGCPHLDLRYWDGARTALYLVASLFSFAAIPSLVWSAVNGLIFLATLLIAVGAYPCGGGSMWCWMIFVAGLVLSAVDAAARILLGPRAERVLRARRIRWAR